MIMMNFDRQLGIRPNLVDPSLRFFHKVFCLLILIFVKPVGNSGENFDDSFTVLELGGNIGGRDGGEVLGLQVEQEL